jgi:hypothetical protein
VGFRDEHEAKASRIDALERELTSTKQELDAVRLRTAELDPLRQKLTAVEKERDTLRAGVEPVWRTRFATALFVGALGAVGGGLAVYRSVVATTEATQELELERARLEVEQRSLRSRAEAAEARIAESGASHGDELALLRHDLQQAREERAGPALLITATVRNTHGSVPAHVGDECVMTVRDLAGDICLANLRCGEDQLFPFVLPAPDVTCTAADGAAWRAAGAEPLARLHADANGPPLLEYDAAHHTLHVAETAVPWSADLHVDRVLPYQVD